MSDGPLTVAEQRSRTAREFSVTDPEAARPWVQRLVIARERIQRFGGPGHIRAVSELTAAAPGVLGSVAATCPRPGMETISILATLEQHQTGGVWLHSSVCGFRRNGKPRIPSWGELSFVKGLVHGDELVVQVLPPRAEYVDLIDALHLWERLDAPTLPIEVVR